VELMNAVVDKVWTFVKVLLPGHTERPYNDNWPSVNSDAAEVIYRVMWMTWERNQNLYYHLYGINSFEEYVHIRKMNDLIDKIVNEVAFNGAAYIRIPAGIELFTEVIIFGDVLGGHAFSCRYATCLQRCR